MVWLLQQTLRSYICGCAATVHYLIATRHNLRETEVSNLHSSHSLVIVEVVLFLAQSCVAVIVKLDKNILRLNISVQDAATVQVLHTFKQLFDYNSDLVLREVHLIEIMVEFPATNTLHGYVNPLARFKELEHLDNVGVGDHTDDK